MRKTTNSLKTIDFILKYEALTVRNVIVGGAHPKWGGCGSVDNGSSIDVSRRYPSSHVRRLQVSDQMRG